MDDLRVDLEGRLARLEAQNRALRQGGVLLGILLLAATAILVDQLRRRDDDAGARDPGELVLRDAGGNARATLSADVDGTRLRLFDGDGRKRASLAVSVDGEPGLALFDASEKPRAVLEIVD